MENCVYDGKKKKADVSEYGAHQTMEAIIFDFRGVCWVYAPVCVCERVN